MRLIPIAANLTKLEYPNMTVFYSYQTPVAISFAVPFSCDDRCFRTNAFFSVTTSRHLSKIGAKGWTQVSQAELEKMARGSEGSN